jgi:hypothetical protein
VSRRHVWSLIALAAAASPLAAQRSPYVGDQGRAIKALSEDELHALLVGEGMSLALPAELNGYPGPRHVLDMADSLGLDSAQRRAAQDVFARMQDRARRLGAQIIAGEARLDSAFATRSITPDQLDAMVTEVGALRARLRVTHLSAHLEMMALLSDDQVTAYRRLRGYAMGAHGGHRH